MWVNKAQMVHNQTEVAIYTLSHKVCLDPTVTLTMSNFFCLILPTGPANVTFNVEMKLWFRACLVPPARGVDIYPVLQGPHNSLSQIPGTSRRPLALLDRVGDRRFRGLKCLKKKKDPNSHHKTQKSAQVSRADY